MLHCALDKEEEADIERNIDCHHDLCINHSIKTSFNKQCFISVVCFPISLKLLKYGSKLEVSGEISHARLFL